MKPSLVIGGLVAAGVLAAAVVVPSAPGVAPVAPSNGSPAPSIASSQLAPGSPTSAAPSTSARAECRFAPGEQLAYRFTSNASSGVALPGLPAGAQLAASLEGHLRLRSVRGSEDGAVLVAQLTDLEVRAPGVSTADLSSPFLLEVGADCRLLRFARARATAKVDARNTQALVWSTLFSLTEGEAALEDGLGQYMARFSRQGGRVERHQAQYSSLWQQRAANVPATGLLVVELGDGPWFESAQSRTSMTLPEGTTSTQLELTRVAPAPGLAIAVNEADFTWEDLLPVSSPRAFAERPFNKYDVARREKVRNLSLDQALTQFDQRTAGSQGLQETWPELSAWFEVHPEGIPLALEKLHAHQVPAISIAPLYTALGKARVPQARDALLGIRRDVKQPPMDRVRATFNLLDRADVGVALAQELADDAADLGQLEHKQAFLRGESLLALGMMAGLRGEPRLEAVARETFTRVLTTAPLDSQASRSALKAVGNLGDATMLPVIAPAAGSSDLFTRIAAAHAFRRMPPASSEATALEWLAREPHPFVKRQLYITIRRQYFDAQVAPSEAMTKQAMADLAVTKAPIDRKTIIRFLAKSSMIQQPEFRRFLVAQAKRERNSGILNVFTDMLTPAEISEALR